MANSVDKPCELGHCVAETGARFGLGWNPNHCFGLPVHCEQCRHGITSSTQTEEAIAVQSAKKCDGPSRGEEVPGVPRISVDPGLLEAVLPSVFG